MRRSTPRPPAPPAGTVPGERGKRPGIRGGTVFLVGFMGAGKSTVGRRLARLTGRRFVDLDREIERREGRTVARLFAEEGEGAFRRAERSALEALGTTAGRVVGTGGGAFTGAANRRLIGAAGISVWLRCSLETALGRLDADGGGGRAGRPLLAGGLRELARLHRRRRAHYALADLVVDTAGKGPAAVAREVAALIADREGRRAAPAGGRTRAGARRAAAAPPSRPSRRASRRP